MIAVGDMVKVHQYSRDGETTREQWLLAQVISVNEEDRSFSVRYVNDSTKLRVLDARDKHRSWE